MHTSIHKLVGGLVGAVVLGVLLLVVLASLMAGASIFLAGTGSRSNCTGTPSRCVPTFMTSEGNPRRREYAYGALAGAAIGLMIVILAPSLVSTLTGAIAK